MQIYRLAFKSDKIRGHIKSILKHVLTNGQDMIKFSQAQPELFELSVKLKKNKIQMHSNASKATYSPERSLNTYM